jgi:hypothetical protein
VEHHAMVSTVDKVYHDNTSRNTAPKARDMAQPNDLNAEHQGHLSILLSTVFGGMNRAVRELNTEEA